MQVGHCEKTRCIVSLFQYKHHGSCPTIYPSHCTDKTHPERLLLLNTALPEAQYKTLYKSQTSRECLRERGFTETSETNRRVKPLHQTVSDTQTIIFSEACYQMNEPVSEQCTVIKCKVSPLTRAMCVM